MEIIISLTDIIKVYREQLAEKLGKDFQVEFVDEGSKDVPITKQLIKFKSNA